MESNFGSELKKISEINNQINQDGSKNSPTSANDMKPYELSTNSFSIQKNKLREIQEKKAEGTDESAKNTGSREEADSSLDK